MHTWCPWSLFVWRLFPERLWMRFLAFSRSVRVKTSHGGFLSLPSSVWSYGHAKSRNAASSVLVFQLGRVRIARDAPQRRNAGVSRCGPALHKHGVQARHLGGEESVNAMKYRKQVGELQLLQEIIINKSGYTYILKTAGLKEIQ